VYVIMGALFSACLFLGVNNASSVQPVVSIERTVFYREKAAGMYSPISYAMAQVSAILPGMIFRTIFHFQIAYFTVTLSYYQGLVEIPYVAVQTIVFGVITYYMVNFERDAGKISSFHIDIRCST